MFFLIGAKWRKLAQIVISGVVCPNWREFAHVFANWREFSQIALSGASLC